MTLRRSLGAFGAVGLAVAGLLFVRAGSGTTAGYAARSFDDTLRVRLASAGAAERRGREALGAIVVGYLSPRGLPPMQGALVVTDTGLVFRSADGRYASTLPVVGPVRHSPRGRWRASAVSLAYVDDALGRRSYLFRVEGGVFETDAPGALMDVAAHPRWLDSLGSREWTSERPLIHPTSAEETTALVDVFMRGTYADTLYAVFGRPARPAGLVGERGRAIGRLGEYVATRDSLALDPSRMTSVSQLRHTLAHELAHRWQARSSGQLALLWRDVPGIRDAKRYGYRDVGEHQAEAAAFAVHFLLATAAVPDAGAESATLDHYELLVPGTRIMARYFAMQPVFARHPLRPLLTTGRNG
ncbi:MAG TPA: hypothetical protein VMY76_09695 [Gemmatimonadales bacterium]|nr:hypothetical protein [Gemmatimonadales bacterium]